MLIRVIQDLTTIIVLGNKYNRNIYHAKDMANIFQFYFDTDEEETPDNIKEDSTKIKTSPASCKNEKNNL
ncbi:MAG: hypothetical protein H0W12_10370 [Chitinophagaceae bacterium]|nr:hypothetical protein [Chitinophagaceae bacterium]